ncbi:MAG: class I SAM-dependent methyltransferase [Anaerolineae bacterium]|nr:class I SAM-dependent methyltransferase [Anaerolineae bacterium]
MTLSNASAFDAFAAGYDDDFTHSPLARLLRPRVWAHLAEQFRSGQHLLELTCGTGEDAVWLARQGLRVTATDGSAEMVRVAQAKAARAGVAEQVQVARVSLQEIAALSQEAIIPLTHPPSPLERDDQREGGEGKFDGAFSNFGGLNTIGDWQPLAQALAALVRPGGRLVLVPMGPFCPWEISWHLLHGQPRTAFRRFGGPAPAKIGPAVIPIWYPSTRRLRRDFSPWFRHLYTESLELWLPPSYLAHLVERWPKLFARLNDFERATAHVTRSWGDHYIIIFERKMEIRD